MYTSLVNNKQTSQQQDECQLRKTFYKIEDLPMGAHVLLSLLSELGKRDKMRGLPNIFSLYRKELNKFNKA